MSKTKRYELLNGLPAYGSMYIPISPSEESFYLEGVAVRFYKKDGSNWVANFAPGWAELTNIVTLDNTSYLLIVAKGACYIMNPGRHQTSSYIWG